MTQSRAFMEWARRLESGTFTHSQCRQWCRVVIPTSRGEEHYSRSSLTRPECTELRTRMRIRHGVGITEEHAAKGRDWIRKNARRLGIAPEIAENIAGFRFLGDGYDIGNRFRSYYVPVWRLRTTDGREFDYAAPPWQARAGAESFYWSELERTELEQNGAAQ